MQPTRREFGIFTHLLLGTVSLSLTAWFSYSAINGNSGLHNLASQKDKIAEMQGKLQEIQSDIKELEIGTHRLSEHYLDLELLDERARTVLGVARPDELILD